MIKLIIFDWDDVFTLGSKEGYIACLHETLVDLDVHLDPAEEERRIHETWSKPHRDELINLLKEKPELVDKACEIYEDKFFGDAFVNALTYVEGANELLENIKNKYVLTVATGAHPKVLKEQVFPKFKVPNVFVQIISTYDLDDSAKSKPHPFIAETIMKTQGFSSAETIVVGDAKNDVLMAQAAGIEPIVVLTGHLTKGQAEELGVHYIIEDVTQLQSVLAQLNN